MKNIKSEKNFNKIKLILLLFSSVLMVPMNLSSETKADVYTYDYSIGVAFTTTKILGDNPAITTFFPINTTTVGGSFNGAMPGVEVKGQYKLDEIGDWRLVGGVNYSFYSARERIPSGNITNRLTHDLNILSPLIGINYTLFRFPSAMSSFYTGFEFRYNYVHLTSFKYITENKVSGQKILQREINKGNAGRFGGLFKLGLEGELYENYMINVSWGYDMLNLLGRDPNRGQLLTPFSSDDLLLFSENEMREDFTNNFYFSLMIQYRF